MAIFNLLSDGNNVNVSNNVKDLCHDPVISFLEFALKEQYVDIIQAYENGIGQFGNPNCHQYNLVRYYNASCNSFNSNFHNISFKYVVEHMDNNHVFRYNSVPKYKDMGLA